MIEFRQELQNKLLELCETWTDKDADSTNYVATYDNHLHDVPMEETPFLVVNVRRQTKETEGEIGEKHGLSIWEVHIYYISLEEDYNVGDKKRDNILSRIEKELEEDRRLGNFTVTGQSVTEKVYDNSITDILFDSSGQEQYYSFVSEMYLNVYTSSN